MAVKNDDTEDAVKVRARDICGLFHTTTSMGSSASKAARKLPKRTETPSWAGARTPHPTDPPSHNGVRASEHKTEDIQADGQDPHFLANLNRLGPVRVDHHMQTVRANVESTERLFKSRAQSEFEAASIALSQGNPKNRLPALTLSELLDERKSVNTTEGLQKIAAKYGIDLAKMESIARFVNSPSVDSRAEVKTVGKDGNEVITVPAVWIQPRLSK